MTEENALWRFKNEHEPLGEFGERLWANVMHACGFRYVQLATLPPLNGKGPRLQGSNEILPDFEITAGIECQRVYMDSKCKTKPVLYKNANELRHGIDRKDFESYRAVAGMHRQKCVLGIIELFEDNGREWSGALLVETLGRLGEPFNGFSNQSHMVYWPSKRFQEVGRYRPLALLQIAYGEIQASAATRELIHERFVIKRETVQARFF